MGCRSLLALAWLALVSSAALATEEPPVSICADATRPPPAIYWARDASGKKTRELVGFEVDPDARRLCPRGPGRGVHR